MNRIEIAWSEWGSKEPFLRCGESVSIIGKCSETYTRTRRGHCNEWRHSNVSYEWWYLEELRHVMLERKELGWIGLKSPGLKELVSGELKSHSFGVGESVSVIGKCGETYTRTWRGRSNEWQQSDVSYGWWYLEELRHVMLERKELVWIGLKSPRLKALVSEELKTHSFGVGESVSIIGKCGETYTGTWRGRSNEWQHSDVSYGWWYLEELHHVKLLRKELVWVGLKSPRLEWLNIYHNLTS